MLIKWHILCIFTFSFNSLMFDSLSIQDINLSNTNIIEITDITEKDPEVILYKEDLSDNEEYSKVPALSKQKNKIENIDTLVNVNKTMIDTHLRSTYISNQLDTHRVSLTDMNNKELIQKYDLLRKENERLKQEVYSLRNSNTYYTSAISSFKYQATLLTQSLGETHVELEDSTEVKIDDNVIESNEDKILKTITDVKRILKSACYSCKSLRYLFYNLLHNPALSKAHLVDRLDLQLDYDIPTQDTLSHMCQNMYEQQVQGKCNQSIQLQTSRLYKAVGKIRDDAPCIDIAQLLEIYHKHSEDNIYETTIDPPLNNGKDTSPYNSAQYRNISNQTRHVVVDSWVCSLWCNLYRLNTLIDSYIAIPSNTNNHVSNKDASEIFKEELSVMSLNNISIGKTHGISNNIESMMHTLVDKLTNKIKDMHYKDHIALNNSEFCHIKESILSCVPLLPITCQPKDFSGVSECIECIKHALSLHQNLASTALIDEDLLQKYIIILDATCSTDAPALSASDCPFAVIDWNSALYDILPTYLRDNTNTSKSGNIIGGNGTTMHKVFPYTASKSLGEAIDTLIARLTHYMDLNLTRVDKYKEVVNHQSEIMQSVTFKLVQFLNPSV